jgi:hypothetical protein
MSVFRVWVAVQTFVWRFQSFFGFHATCDVKFVISRGGNWQILCSFTASATIDGERLKACIVSVATVCIVVIFCQPYRHYVVSFYCFIRVITLISSRPYNYLY